jgi:xanthine dehydrogenase accessory factor
MNSLKIIARALQENVEFVIATVVDAQGSTPARAGFRMIVTAIKTAGTVGGGALENSVISEARSMLPLRKEARLVKMDLSELEMQCGGQVQVFLEPYYRKPSLWIFGAGHIARALTPLAVSIGFCITVVDNREGFAVKDRFPAAAVLMTKEYSDALSEMPHDGYAVIVTHGHRHDEEIVLALAHRKPPLPYIGMIGSRKKVLIPREKILKNGDKWDNIYSPIGLNIGGDSPDEIALSIAAELQGVYNKKTDLPHCRLEP